MKEQWTGGENGDPILTDWTFKNPKIQSLLQGL